MDLELVVDAGFDPLDDQPVGVLDLAVGLWVIDRGPIHSDFPGVAEIQTLAACELSSIISNNAIGNSKPVDNVLDELSRPL